MISASTEECSMMSLKYPKSHVRSDPEMFHAFYNALPNYHGMILILTGWLGISGYFISFFRLQ